MSARLAASLALAIVVHGLLLLLPYSSDQATGEAPPSIMAVLVRPDIDGSSAKSTISASPYPIQAPVTKGESIPRQAVHSPVERADDKVSANRPTAINDAVPDTTTTPAEPSLSLAAPASVHLPASMIASSCRKPDYPPAALRAGEQGLVLLRIHVTEDGRVTESDIERSSGFRRLDEAARRALVLCQFTPAKEQGRPVAGWARIEYRWQIEP